MKALFTTVLMIAFASPASAGMIRFDFLDAGGAYNGADGYLEYDPEAADLDEIPATLFLKEVFHGPTALSGSVAWENGYLDGGLRPPPPKYVDENGGIHWPPPEPRVRGFFGWSVVFPKGTTDLPASPADLDPTQRSYVYLWIQTPDRNEYGNVFWNAFPVTFVPEPSTGMLLGLGLAAFGVLRRK